MDCRAWCKIPRTPDGGVSQISQPTPQFEQVQVSVCSTATEPLVTNQSVYFLFTPKSLKQSFKLDSINRIDYLNPRNSTTSTTCSPQTRTSQTMPRDPMQQKPNKKTALFLYALHFIFISA